MRFSVDPWDPAYATSAGAQHGDSSAQVDLDVEVPAPDWTPVDPPPRLGAAAAVLVVDGVRRVDDQVWVHEPTGQAAPASMALCASYAAGVICCCPDQGAHLLAAEVHRGLFTTADQGADLTTSAGRYQVVKVETRTPDTATVPPAQLLSLALQRGLAVAEQEVAEQARASHNTGHSDHHGSADDLLVVDGPLHDRRRLPRAIGFVKTHRSEYLPEQLAGVGSRYEVYTWYLRLPCAPGAPWAGVVRVECSSEVSAAGVEQLLERITAAVHGLPPGRAAAQGEV